MNKIILTGNICRELEINYYNDRKYLKNTIAVRRDFKNKDGEYDSDFFNFSVWGNQAEYLSNYASKGSKIIICGKLLNNNYEKDGQLVYSNDIQVENVEILSKSNNTSDSSDKEQTSDPFADFGDAVSIDDNFLD